MTRTAPLTLAMAVTASSGCWLALDLSDKEYTLEGGAPGEGGHGAGADDGTIAIAHGDASFSIDADEVTDAEYMAWLDSGASAADLDDARCSWNTSLAPGDFEGDEAACGAIDPSCEPGALAAEIAASPEQPIHCVDWCDALAYCVAHGKRLCGGPHGESIVLTAETSPFVFADFANDDSEWYYACSAGVGQRFPYGDDLDEAACNDGFGGLGTRVDVGAPSCEGGFPGLFDMSGNVDEWVDACFPGQSGDANCYRAGGAYYSDGAHDQGRPLPSCDEGTTFGQRCQNNSTGFRCCRD